MKKILFLILALLPCGVVQGADQVLVKSKPVAATVFTSGGAAVTREGTADVPSGRSVLKIADMPRAIDSCYAARQSERRRGGDERQARC